jgi:hypothetical protein
LNIKTLPIKMENQRANVMRRHKRTGHKKIVIFQLHGGALSNSATHYPIIPKEKEKKDAQNTKKKHYLNAKHHSSMHSHRIADASIGGLLCKLAYSF